MAKTLARLLRRPGAARYALDWLKGAWSTPAPCGSSGRSWPPRAALERLEIITNHKIEESTKGKPQLALWL